MLVRDIRFEIISMDVTPESRDLFPSTIRVIDLLESKAQRYAKTCNSFIIFRRRGKAGIGIKTHQKY